MRVIGYFRPGLVQLHVWDVGQFTGSLPGLYPLTRTGLLTVHDPGGLAGLLDELSDRIRRVHTRVLVGGLPVAGGAGPARAARAPSRGSMAVLLGNRGRWRDEDQRQLQRVAARRSGLRDLGRPRRRAADDRRAGRDGPPPGGARRTGRRRGRGDHADDRAARLRRARPAAAARRRSPTVCHDDRRRARALRTRIGTFGDLLPRDSSGPVVAVRAVRAPVGFAEGMPVSSTLADASPHALIGGPSGSGKTNLLLTMIASMAARYSPGELELYLLDFKEGVSFAQFAPGRRDPTWLPHARLIGVNINTDREFGLALLQPPVRRDAPVAPRSAKEHEVTKLEELRGADPEGRWPRIVAVIDEFQFLFAERDAVTREAVRLLEDVARRGRSQGIHLVLASQDVSGIEAFWGRPAIFEQFVLRIGLPRARRILAEANDATLGLPRWHAVINHESGMRHGNEIARIPDATARGAVDNVQQRLYAHFVDESADQSPPLFDGSKAPQVGQLIAGLRSSPVPRAIIGQRIDVDASPAAVPLPTSPGRNISIVGTALKDAVAVLGAAAASLGAQHKQGDVRFVLAPLVIDADTAAAALEQKLEGHKVDMVRLLDFRERIEGLAQEIRDRLAGEARVPVYLVLYAADAADSVLERSGTDALRTVLHSGPETGVHTIGWWRSPQRLKTLLTLGAAPDDLGCVVGLDVQGAELGTLIPGLPPAWAPRPARALVFDRARHSRPEVVIVAASDDTTNGDA